MPNIGPLELGIVLVIAVIILGPKRIPEAAKSIGKGIRGFRDTVDNKDDEKPTLASETIKEQRADEKKKADEKKADS